MIYRLILVTISILCFSSCKKEIVNFDEDTFFKYSDGSYIGDVINFNDRSVVIKNDMIFIDSKPVAKFVKIENRWYLGDKILHIQELNGKKAGRYIEK